MDFTLFENATSVSAIYKRSLPTFTKIEVVKITIIPGEDTELILTLDTTELPEVLPLKWSQKRINTVQFEIDFIDVDLKKICLTKGMDYNFIMQRKDDKKVVILKNLLDNKEIIFDSKWAYIRNISGYER